MSINRKVLIANSESGVIDRLLDILSRDYETLVAHSEREVRSFFEAQREHPHVSVLPYSGFRTQDDTLEPLVMDLRTTNRISQIILTGEGEDYTKAKTAHDKLDAWYLPLTKNPGDIDSNDVRRTVQAAYMRYAERVGRNTVRRGLMHDLRGVLMAPVGYASLISSYDHLMNCPEGDEIRGHLKAIEEAGITAEKIISQLQGTLVRSGSNTSKNIPILNNKVDAEVYLRVEETILNIVYVDDSAVERDLFKESLTALSNLDSARNGYFGHDAELVRYKLHMYTNAMDALEALPSLGTVHLLVTDRQMRRMNGFELLNEIATTDDQVRIRPGYENIEKLAMLSGGADETDIKRAERYGTFLHKPLFPESVEPTIYAIIRGNYKQLGGKAQR